MKLYEKYPMTEINLSTLSCDCCKRTVKFTKEYMLDFYSEVIPSFIVDRVRFTEDGFYCDICAKRESESNRKAKALEKQKNKPKVSKTYKPKISYTMARIATYARHTELLKRRSYGVYGSKSSITSDNDFLKNV